MPRMTMDEYSQQDRNLAHFNIHASKVNVLIYCYYSLEILKGPPLDRPLLSWFLIRLIGLSVT